MDFISSMAGSRGIRAVGWTTFFQNWSRENGMQPICGLIAGLCDPKFSYMRIYATPHPNLRLAVRIYKGRNRFTAGGVGCRSDVATERLGPA